MGTEQCLVLSVVADVGWNQSSPHVKLPSEAFPIENEKVIRVDGQRAIQRSTSIAVGVEETRFLVPSATHGIFPLTDKDAAQSNRRAYWSPGSHEIMQGTDGTVPYLLS
jgi:hypothetical protein